MKYSMYINHHNSFPLSK